MGAATFTATCPNPDPKAAFAELVREALHEHGHGGYTGTLAEKRSYTIIEARPTRYQDAINLANHLIEHGDPRINDKWGPAGAIALMPHDTPTSTTTRCVTITLHDPDRLRAFNRQDHHQLVQQHLAAELSPHQRVTSATLVSANARISHHSSRTPGNLRTVYTVTGSHRAHDTLASARAELDTLLEHDAQRIRHDLTRAADPRSSAWHERLPERAIRASVVRDTTPDLARGELRHHGETLTFDVEIATFTPSSQRQPPAGWLFFGWAST